MLSLIVGWSIFILAVMCGVFWKISKWDDKTSMRQFFKDTKVILATFAVSITYSTISIVLIAFEVKLPL